MEKSNSQKPNEYFELMTHLEDIYNTTNDAIERLHTPRYDELCKRFEKLYNKQPTYIVRAPGCANLIGEQIDDMDYGVISIAIEQDCLIAFSLTKQPTIEINHIQSALFAPIKLSNDPSQKFQEKSQYANYFLAGYKAALAESKKKDFVGLQILISGNVPLGAGLSSSSAFTLSAALTALFANNLHKTCKKNDLVESLFKYERAAEITRGGLRRAVSAIGVRGQAFYIQPKPIRTTPLTLPKGFCFILANSLTPSPKLVTLGTRYNKRIVECVLAIEILKVKLNIKDDIKLDTLNTLQEFLGYTFEDMMNLIKDHIEDKAYSVSQLEGILGSPLIKRVVRIPNSDLVLNTNNEYFPYKRALHIFKEAERVLKFKEICSKLTTETEKSKHNQAAIELGKLMDQSHNNCRDLYDCSSDELEYLTKLCRKNGALGSKLTGMGWGGCCISLVLESEVESFIENIQNSYYLNEEKNLMVTDDLNMYIFATGAGREALILDPQYEIWYQFFSMWHIYGKCIMNDLEYEY